MNSAKAREIADEYVTDFLLKTITTKSGGPERYAGLGMAFLEISLAVKKAQPKFWKHYERYFITNMYTVLTSKNTEEAVQHFLEDLENAVGNSND